jgi:iron complex outermembrane recepter protein
MGRIRHFSMSLSIGLSLATLAAGPAIAQDTGAAAPGAAPAGDSAPAPAASGDVGTSQGGDIVVTAQRRSERLRDVPISITALNAETLTKSGINTTLDLEKVVPGVILPLYGAYVLPSIRGISSLGAGLGDSTAVAVYVDGVYVASQSTLSADLPDVQSIQVLKGPQGTLYGQNAAGGAIIIDTIAPSFKLKGKVTVGYGNYDNKTANGYIAGPISSTLAFAFSASYQDRHGFSRDDLRGGWDKGLQSKSVRGKILWQPSPSTSLTFGGYYQTRSDSNAYSREPVNGNSTGWANIINNNLPGPRSIKRRHVALNRMGQAKYKRYGLSLIGKFGLGDFGTLNTVSAYVHDDINNFSDVDGTPNNNGENDNPIFERYYIQEVNLTSNKLGRFYFTAGMFYMHRNSFYRPSLFTRRAGNTTSVYPALPPNNLFIGTNTASYRQSLAGYAELNYDFTDQFTLTLAGRYAAEKVLIKNIGITTPFVIGETPLPKPLRDPRGTHHFNKFLPKAVLRFKPDNNHTFYASYSQGFRSGFVNGSRINNCTPHPACIDAPVKPEIVTAYEVGYKGKLSPNLDLNLAVFHYLYKDIQIFIYDPIGGSQYQNAAGGKINGVELEANFRPAPGLTFHGGVSYLDTKYSSFKKALVYRPKTLAAGLGNAQFTQDVSGFPLMRTPKWTANGSINYSHSFSGGELGLYVAANYNSGFSFDPQGRIKQKPYALVDATLSFAPSAVPGTQVSVWVKNLTDHDYYSNILESTGGDQSGWSEPRTFGVRFEYKF